MERSYKYLGYFLLGLIPLTVAGFYQSYFSLFPKFAGIKTAHHFHAAVASLWLSLLIAQPFLIRFKKIQTHRVLGKISYLVFPVLIFSFLVMIAMQGLTLENFFVPAADTAILMLFYTLAIINRRSPPLHMRYMILAALVFINPTVARILLYYGLSDPVWFHVVFGIIYFILIGLIFYDRQNGRDYTPYLVGMLVFVIYQIAFHFLYLF